MTLATAKQRTNTWVTGLLPDLVAFQQEFHRNNGRYCQFILSHSRAPDGDTDETPDRLDERPADAAGDPSWRGFAQWRGAPPGPTPAAVRVDVHGPRG